VIRSFADRRTKALFEGVPLKGIVPGLARRARIKLQQLDAATGLEFLRVPPGNRLEALRGNRAGQWSIRVNNRWRICFRFHGGDAHEVEFVDYH
jgi:proteic killer suppression protein